MPPTSPTAYAVAQRLLVRATPDAGPGPPDLVSAVERVAGALATTLSRWFGPYGYHALLARALAEATSQHPALSAIRVRGPLDPALEGLAEAARLHGDGAMVEGLTTVLATIVELLGRLIGEDMAVNLMDLVVPAPTRGTAHVDDTEPAS